MELHGTDERHEPIPDQVAKKTLSTETVAGPTGCKHAHEAPIGVVDDAHSCVFNRAQTLSKSTFLLQGSQWSGSYLSHHLKISPTHHFESRELTAKEQPNVIQGEVLESCLELSIRRQMTGCNGRDATCEGRSKIFLWEDSDASCPLTAEARELPPRVEAFELPCFFSETPERVLIVKRTFTDEVTALSVALSSWLQEVWGILVYVEALAHKEMTYWGAKNIEVWTGCDDFASSFPAGLSPTIDLVISLGGDGTTLWICTMFPDVVPPVFGVTLGSLSYLNQFKQDEMLSKLDSILSRKAFKVQLRARLFVTLVDEDDIPRCASHCVNECVIDRGPLSTMASIDVYVNDRLFTSVSADGLILATPTGSTAYSMSAGGPMVHPNVPCILFTPISPHSLSMRPLILPDTVTLRIRNPTETRNNLWLSLDGRARRELARNDSVLVSLSPFPFPLVCKATCECGDAWLQALTDNLNWGLRIRQRRHSPRAPEIESLGAPSVFDFPLPIDLRDWHTSRLVGNQKKPSETKATETLVSRSNMSPSPSVMNNEEAVSWPQLLANSSRSRTLDLVLHPYYVSRAATESLDESFESRRGTSSCNEDRPVDESPSASRPFIGSRVLNTSASAVSMHSFNATNHHSPFFQPRQKLRAAIAISPGHPRDNCVPVFKEEKTD